MSVRIAPTDRTLDKHFLNSQCNKIECPICTANLTSLGKISKIIVDVFTDYKYLRPVYLNVCSTCMKVSRVYMCRKGHKFLICMHCDR